MKPASPELLALMATRQWWSVDLYTISVPQPIGSSIILRYCSGIQPVTANGITYPSGPPFFDRKDNKAKCHWKIGVEVDTLTFDVLPGTATVEGEPFLSAVRQGVFDGAELTLEKAFMPTYGNTAAGTLIMFVGRVAEIDCGRSLATFTVNSHLELLNQNMPRNIYQASCSNTLFDSNCTLDRTAFAVTGSAITSSTSSLILTSSLSQANGYFDQGSLVFTNGANAGYSRTVKGYSHGAPSLISLIAPFPNTPANGDAFTIYPGCDKTQSTCTNKFSNLQHFRGFPFVPAIETAT